MSAPSLYTHYVFDLDGTLVDSIPGIDAAARAALAELEPGEAMPSLRSFIGPPIKIMFERALKWDDAVRLDALERAFRKHYDGGAWRETVPYEGVDAGMCCLHRGGARLNVLTNKPAVPTGRILDHLGWTALFDAVVSPQSRTPPFADKTAAALDLRARLGLPPARTLLLGDSQDDHAAALACGFDFAAATWGYGSAVACKPGCGLANFSDILNLAPTSNA